MRYLLPFLLLVVVAPQAYASANDPVVPILLGLTILFLGAKLGGLAADHLSQPAVLGELLAGVVIGNLFLIGFDGLEFLKSMQTFEMMAGLGVILLLFEVGLESSVADLMKVGLSSTLVAIVGVVLPFGMGWAVSAALMPEKTIYVHAFIGATLCATSVGITARVLKDLGKIATQEAKIILGAAVIDDVLGLVILAVVTGVIASVSAGGDGVGATDVIFIFVKAIGFLAIALVVGARFAPFWFKFGAKLKSEGMLFTMALSFCFFVSYLSALAGLAPIVGAFAAGLIVDGTGYAKFFGSSERSIEDLILPISKFFVPLFFVTMGMKVSLDTLGDISVIGIAVALTAVAFISKQACGLAVVGKGINRLAIGIGMIPRGEVGLIFAMIGTGLAINGVNIIDKSLYSAIVLMVMATTMVTPPALKWSMGRNNGKPRDQISNTG